MHEDWADFYEVVGWAEDGEVYTTLVRKEGNELSLKGEETLTEKKNRDRIE